MIDRPPPPAAPKSDQRVTGRATPKWPVRTLPAMWSGHYDGTRSPEKLSSNVKLLGTEEP
jgi:hypothetical protein